MWLRLNINISKGGLFYGDVFGIYSNMLSSFYGNTHSKAFNTEHCMSGWKDIETMCRVI